jgi:hypothetical protein
MDNVKRRNSPKTPKTESLDAEIRRPVYRYGEEFGYRNSETKKLPSGTQQPDRWKLTANLTDRFGATLGTACRRHMGITPRAESAASADLARCRGHRRPTGQPQMIVGTSSALDGAGAKRREVALVSIFLDW